MTKEVWGFHRWMEIIHRVLSIILTRIPSNVTNRVSMPKLPRKETRVHSPVTCLIRHFAIQTDPNPTINMTIVIIHKNPEVKVKGMHNFSYIEQSRLS